MFLNVSPKGQTGSAQRGLFLFSEKRWDGWGFH